MKSSSQLPIVLGGSVAGVVVLGLVLTFLLSTTGVRPISIDGDTWTLEDYTEDDPSLTMEYYYSTTHVGDKSYAVGAKAVNGNILPLIRIVDEEGQLLSDYTFGLEALGMSPSSFVGDVNVLRYWPEHEVFVASLDLESNMVINGLQVPLGGTIGALLDPEHTYGDYISIMVEISLDFTDVHLLLITEGQTPDNWFYYALDFVLLEDEVIVGYSFSPLRQQFGFTFDNPRATEEDADLLLQTYQYESGGLLTLEEGESLTIATPFTEMMDLELSSINHDVVPSDDDVFVMNLRLANPYSVALADYEAFMDALTIDGLPAGLKTTLLNDIQRQYESVDEDEVDVYISLDMALVIDGKDLSIASYVFFENTLGRGISYHSQMLRVEAMTYMVTSYRLFNGDEFEVMTTLLYRVNADLSLSLLHTFDEEEGFFSAGAFISQQGIFFYGTTLPIHSAYPNQLGYNSVFFGEFDIDTHEWVFVKTLSGTQYNGAYDGKINQAKTELTVFFASTNADGDFLEYEFNLETYIVGKIKFSINN